MAAYLNGKAPDRRPDQPAPPNIDVQIERWAIGRFYVGVLTTGNIEFSFWSLQSFCGSNGAEFRMVEQLRLQHATLPGGILYNVWSNRRSVPLRCQHLWNLIF